MKAVALILALVLCSIPISAQANSTASTGVLETVQQALSYNPSLKSNLEARQKAIHEVSVAKSGYFPTIDVWADYGINLSDNATSRIYGEEDTFYGSGSIGLSLSQSIWDGGATSASVKSARANLESTNSLVDESAISIAFAAISVHIDVHGQRILLEMAENHLQECFKTFNTVNQRFNQGIATIGEVEQMRSRTARAKTSLLSYEIALDVVSANYLRIVGIDPPNKLSPVPMPKQLFDSVEEIKELTLKNNPTIQKNMNTIATLLGEKDYAKSAYMPTISVEVGPNYSDTVRVRVRPRDESNLSLDATLQLRWNLFRGGADSARVKASSASVRKAKQNLQQAMDAINEDIEVSFTRTLNTALQAEHMSVAAESSEKSKISFNEQFLAGKKSLLEVLDAEAEAYNAGVEALIFEDEHITGSYRLLALAGTLLNELNIDPESIKQDTVPADSDTSTHEMRWNALDPQP